MKNPSKYIPKLYLTLFTIGLLFFFSCSKEKLNVPENLKEIIKNADCTCDPYINEYSLNDQPLYVLAFKGSACDWRPTYYNQEGKKIEIELSYDDFLQQSRLIKNIWTCKE